MHNKNSKQIQIKNNIYLLYIQSCSIHLYIYVMYTKQGEQVDWKYYLKLPWYGISINQKTSAYIEYLSVQYDI